MRTLKYTIGSVALLAAATACGDDGAHGNSAVKDVADGAAGEPLLTVTPPTRGPLEPPSTTIVTEDAGFAPNDASTDADAALRGVGGHDPEDAGGLLYPTVDVCNDGFRGPTEECDDDNESNTDACLVTCRVRDMRVLEDFAPPDGPLPNRYLGAGRHPVAAASNGFGVAFVETLVTEANPDLNPMVVLAHFGASGTRDSVQRTNISVGTITPLFADPVVAALPGGAYAIAWTDFDGDGDGLGIALRRVIPTGPSPSLSTVQYANDNGLFSQAEPDIFWTGSELVVGWTDDTDVSTAPDIRYRRFDENLAPIDAGDQTLAATSAVEGGLAFGTFKGGWAAAWRENSLVNGVETDGRETVVVRHGTTEWRTEPFWPSRSEDRPALIELDGSHLLIVFSIGTDPMGDGIFDVPRIYGAVLDADAPGTVGMFAVFPDPPGPFAGLFGQSHPNGVRVSVGSNVRYFVAGRGEFTSQDELFLKELSWNATTELVDVSGTPILLPRSSDSTLGDQRFPALAPSSLAPQGAIVAAWDDLYAEPTIVQSERDVMVELIPVPILRLP